MVHGVGALLPLAVLLASHAPCVQGVGNLEGEGGGRLLAQYKCVGGHLC